MRATLELLIVTLVLMAAAVAYAMLGDPGVARPPGETTAAADRADRAAAPAAVTPEVRPDPPSPAGGVNRVHHLTHGGLERRYLVHVPRGYDPSKPCPVVLAFHDILGAAELFVAQSKWDELADRRGVLVVYPDGTGRSTQLLTFNAGTCCGYASRSGVDDVGFVRALLDALPSSYAVDRRRVYATGLGNGAMLCYRLACEMPERLAAVGPVGGAMTVDGPKPARPVPLAHVQGLEDRFAPFDGGPGPTPMQTNYHRPVRDVIAWWVEVNGCRKEPEKVERRKDYTLKRYAPAPGRAGAPVLLYTVPGAGHNWPGGVDATEHKGTGPFVGSVDVTGLLWEFFERFRRDDDTGGRAG